MTPHRMAELQREVTRWDRRCLQTVGARHAGVRPVRLTLQDSIYFLGSKGGAKNDTGP